MVGLDILRRIDPNARTPRDRYIIMYCRAMNPGTSFRAQRTHSPHAGSSK